MNEKKNDCMCEWEEFNKYGCDPKNCDFKTLPFEKKAILERIKQEKIQINSIKEEIIAAQKSNLPLVSDNKISDMADKIKGIEIMTEALREKFSMSVDEIKQGVGVKELTLSERIALKINLRKVLMAKRKNRGKK